MTAPARPLLRYHGGKWMLAPWIISHLPRHRIYVEPFGGAASVLLRKPRSYAEVYNDLDGEVVNLFRVCRERPAELVRGIEWTAYARDEYRLAFEETDDPLESARRMVVRSFMGFGSNAVQRAVKSGFRANASRSGTTPAHDWRHLPPNLLAVAERLRGVTIENRPAAEVIAQQDGPTTLVYADPPYVRETRSNKMHGHHGYTHEMTDADHKDLAEVLRGVRGMVALSGYRCDMYDALYAGWRRIDRDALADGARKRVESLWLNDAAVAGSAQRSLFGSPRPAQAPAGGSA